MKVITVGRSAENDIVINDIKVSRIHLQIVQNDSGACSVVDLNSSNGTYVNGQRITGEVRLNSNDEVRIGNTILPWHDYVKPQTKQQPPTIERLPEPNRQKTNRKVLYAIIGIVLGLLICGAVYVVYTIRAQQIAEENSLAEQQKRKKESEGTFLNTVISQRDESQKLAQTMEKEVEKANDALRKTEDAAARDVANAKQETEKEAAARKAEKRAKETAIKERDAERMAKEDVSKELDAERMAHEATVKEKENTERDLKYAEEEVVLMKQFYGEYYGNMDDVFAKQVCELLKKSATKNNAKDSIKDMFDSADNKGKQSIIEVVKLVKIQNDKKEKERLQLTESFHDEFGSLSGGLAKQIFKQLNEELPKDVGDVKEYLNDQFNQADNSKKKKILNAIRKVKEQNSKAEETKASAAKDAAAVEAGKSKAQTENDITAESNE